LEFFDRPGGLMLDAEKGAGYDTTTSRRMSRAIIPTSSVSVLGSGTVAAAKVLLPYCVSQAARSVAC
jgi:hypothetical protein